MHTLKLKKLIKKSAKICTEKCLGAVIFKLYVDNFGCLFTFCYLDRAIQSKLFNALVMDWMVCKLQVCKSILIEFALSKYVATSK